ncbi:MAG TPA: cellulase family glycosylhydrolase [Tepidisphaeraceae bacterium]|jgi:hypothetical protein|nr:cellulase family glycosylhydrolase [Tepidisphaeraceae bacterium]
MLSIGVTSFCALSLSALLLWSIAPSSAAGAPANDALAADVEQFYPMPLSKPRGGGVASLASATMERLDAMKSPDGRAMLRLTGSSGPVQGAWWFPGHQPLTREQARFDDPEARILVEITTATPVSTQLSVNWRIDESGTPGETVASEPIQIGRDEPTRVVLKVPALEPEAKINGLILSVSTPGEYHVRRLAIARLSSVLVDPIEPGALRLAPEQKITGQAVAGVDKVTVRFVPEKDGVEPTETAADVRDGRFELAIRARDLQPGNAYAVTAQPTGRRTEASPAQRLFVFPTLTGKQCPPVTRRGADLIREGRRFGFVGTNYTPFYLGLSIRADFEVIAQDVLQMKKWGLRVVRVPLDFGMVQPEIGVMPDDPRYKELMVRHGLDPAFVEALEYFVTLAGEMGIYTILDWHGMAVDPYRYFLGGNEQQKKDGKPGTAIAYLAKSPTERGEFDLSNPTHVEALCNAHRWAAKHFKGNPNLLGAEIPFNEPHTKYMAVEAIWRRVVDQTARAVHEGDPNRLLFTLQPSYSHNNLMPSVTWMPPDRADGAAPHFYQANSPIPVRSDAQTMREPWLARESEGVFGWGFPAMLMPYSAVDYPFYNGETGAHGAEMVLPDRPLEEAASILIEAQLVQEYAAGMSGRMEWTLWRYPKAFDPHLETYRKQFTRFAPVFEAGPIDRMRAEVAFVQHPEAIKSGNGYNHGCLPLAKAVLDLHLPHVHYLTDDQFRYIAAAEMSVGLEQVVEAVETLPYKAIVADRRHLDPRVLMMLERMKVPVLWLDRAEDLTTDQLAAFLNRAGIATDQKTPRELQLAEGPGHLIVYRRLDGGTNAAKAYPMVKRDGVFELVDEAGTSVFKGDAKALMAQGIDIDLPLWRSAIYRIVSE